MSARELDGALEAVSDRERRTFVPAALICSVLANIHRNPEQRDEPFTIDEFLPGADAPLTKEEEMIEWLKHLEAVERGEEAPEYDAEAMENFKRKMKQTFKNARPGAVQTASTVGPRGREETL